MNLFTIFFMAVGLSMDCFAVSVASGLSITRLKLRHALTIALFFGGFQAIMPLVGWFGGSRLRGFIGGIDHWIAFGLLFAIGLKMIYESTTLKREEKTLDPLKIYVLLTLAVATSIDALAVGLSLSFLKISIAAPAVIIGAVTFLISFIGVYIGGKFGHFFESKLEIAGGLILIAIGVKILIAHLI